MDGIIKPSLGNVLMITTISSLGIIGGLAVMHLLAKKDVPVASPVARGTLTFISSATTPKAA